MPDEIKIDYYDTFTCTADQCPITCCQEWKIEVDDETYHKWETLKLREDETDYICSKVTKTDGIGMITLNERKQCPYLSEQKLCNLVLKFGDDVLSRTCATFPREIHEFKGRKEYSLVTGCPEVVDLLNRQETIHFTHDLTAFEEDLLCQIRNDMMSIMQTKEYTSAKNFMMIFFLLLDYYKKDNVSYRSWQEYKNEIDLMELSDAIEQMQFHKLNTFEERNELFLDLVQPYRKEKIYENYLDRIITLAEEYSDTYDPDQMKDQLQGFEQKITAYGKLFRNYLIAEFFNSSLPPESDLKTMVVMMQWISLEYTMIKHAIFLTWLVDGAYEVTYSMVRDCMVIISRMTGYDDEDIFEYLENNFQSLVWDWGYLALILGNGEY